MRPITIISGGQTGADRAALDFALEHGLAHAGWCPRGRIAEDGPIDDRYELRETPSRRYSQRTEWNVRDSDATVVFSVSAEARGGTRLTLDIAKRLGKPWLHLSRAKAPPGAAAAQLDEFLRRHNVACLNIAGPRASQAPTIAAFVQDVLLRAIEHVNVARRSNDSTDT